MSRTPFLVAACVLAVAGHGVALAQSGASLQERRLGVIKGTAPGITLVEAPGAASAASAASAAKGQAAAPKPAASSPSIGAARRLDSPALGITLPTARPASAGTGRP